MLKNVVLRDVVVYPVCSDVLPVNHWSVMVHACYLCVSFIDKSNKQLKATSRICVHRSGCSMKFNRTKELMSIAGTQRTWIVHSNENSARYSTGNREVATSEQCAIRQGFTSRKRNPQIFEVPCSIRHRFEQWSKSRPSPLYWCRAPG